MEPRDQFGYETYVPSWKPRWLKNPIVVALIFDVALIALALWILRSIIS